MKILITGGLGHIGSAAIQYFCDREDVSHVYVVDNLLTQRICSLFGLKNKHKLTFKIIDVLDPLFHPMALGWGVTHIIHLAAITNAEASVGHTEELRKNNLGATNAILKLATTSNSSIVFPSSTSVYGSQTEHVTEDDFEAFLNPQSPYAKIKIEEEELLRTAFIEGSVKGVILRLGTIFGVSPGIRFHTAVNKFCFQAAFNEPITVWRTALKQYRPYLDIIDAMSAIHFCLNHEMDGKTLNALTLNATVEQIIEQIRTHQPNLQISFVDSPIMNQLSYKVSNQKLLGLGWRPNGDIKKAVSETMSLFGSSI